MGMALTIPRYTVADLEEFPDDGNRYELLDGVLLVTPLASAGHQEVAARLVGMLHATLVVHKQAKVFSPGVVTLPPLVHLEPDVLVVPPHFPIGTLWAEMNEHWLAVEIFSRSSKRYDRDFKRDAYIALGVQQVWLIDTLDKSVEVCTKQGPGQIKRRVIEWMVPVLNVRTSIDLDVLFEGLP
ncbi:MAG: Uma2 family endonuclease [Gemmatimonadaceae bacterium]